MWPGLSWSQSYQPKPGLCSSHIQFSFSLSSLIVISNFWSHVCILYLSLSPLHFWFHLNSHSLGSYGFYSFFFSSHDLTWLHSEISFSMLFSWWWDLRICQCSWRIILMMFSWVLVFESIFFLFERVGKSWELSFHWAGWDQVLLFLISLLIVLQWWIFYFLEHSSGSCLGFLVWLVLRLQLQHGSQIGQLYHHVQIWKYPMLSSHSPLLDPNVQNPSHVL